MPTFLELCEQLREEVGVQGTVSSTSGQAGMTLRLINYVKKANLKIQRRKVNWKFLWAEWSQVLSGISVDGEFAPPDGLGMFDQTSFWVDAGAADAFPLAYVDHKVWRDNLRHRYSDADQPQFATIKPNGRVAILPRPSTDYTAKSLTADYWRSPVALVSNGQKSIIPEEYHQIIVAQAKMYWAEYAHDTGLYNAAYVEHEDIYRELKAQYLPGNEDDGKSQSSIFHAIEVQ
jgi:hypothetical protein